MSKMVFYKDNVKYQSLTKVEVTLPFLVVNFRSAFLSANGYDCVIDVGYTWNGMSGPVFDTRKNMYASLVHDAMYSMLGIKNKKANRKLADEKFKELLLAAGYSSILANVAYLGVRLFGARYVSGRGITKFTAFNM